MILQEHTVKNIEINSPIRIYDYCVDLFRELPSRKSVKKAITNRRINLNGKTAKSGTYLNNGDVISLLEDNRKPPKIFELDLEVVYEDAELALIVKPAGFPVSGNLYKCIYNALSYNLKESNSPDKLTWPLPVHRLDTPTTGLLLIAKTKRTRIALGKMFEEKQIKKTYLALVQGELKEPLKVNLPVDDKDACTIFHPIEVIPSLKEGALTLVKCFPETGRRHQIRKHLSESGFPIVGDKEYGEQGNVMGHKGLFLFASELQFTHPKTKERLEFSIPQPHKFDQLIARKKSWHSKNS